LWRTFRVKHFVPDGSEGARLMYDAYVVGYMAIAGL
jgi:hypothetical protein